MCTELGTGEPYGIYAITVDPEGYLLLGGTAITGSTDTKPYAFIAKYTPDLEPVWFLRLDSGVTGVADLATDVEGNVFALGAAEGILPDPVLIKISTYGKTQWTQRPLSPAPSLRVAMALDGNADAVLGGNDDAGLFLAKYSSDGTLLWDTEWKNGDVETEAVAADAAGEIFLAAGVPLQTGKPWIPSDLEKHTATGQPAWKVELGGTLVSGVAAGATGDAYVLMVIPSESLARYSSTGDLLWTQALDDFSPSYGLASDASGNAYATGMANDFEGPNYLGVVAKYSPAGNRMWSEELAVPIGIMALTVAASGDGTAFVAGTTDSADSAFITHVSL